MTKNKYFVEVNFGKDNWVTIENETNYKRALDFLRERAQTENRYPMRITKVTSTVVFEEEPTKRHYAKHQGTKSPAPIQKG